MKFAFIIKGNFDSKKDMAFIGNRNVQAIGVSSIEGACAAASGFIMKALTVLSLWRI